MTNQCIVYTQDSGYAALVVPTGEIPLEAVIEKDIPKGVEYKVMAFSDLPEDHTFFDAWVLSDSGIKHDMDKAKAIGHAMRRVLRDEEFRPHDEVIMKQIPGADAVAAEAARQAIREKYASIQIAIEKAESTQGIKDALNSLSN